AKHPTESGLRTEKARMVFIRWSDEKLKCFERLAMKDSGTARDSSRVRIGISSCLLGEKVRFDGGHKKDQFLTSHFGRYVEWVPICPEFEIGLGVPRASIRPLD